ncbi:MAG: response regulator transcription factor [Microbacteriaceae bacterium]
MISVAIVDDQPLIRVGLRMIADSQPDLHVVGEADDSASALALTRAKNPDVVLMDIRMPGVDGIETAKALLAEHPGIRVIMLTTFDVDRYVFDALHAGASGFLFKDVTPERLIDAIKTVAAGDMLLAPQVTRRLVKQFVQRAPVATDAEPRLALLTQRERDVLGELAQGLSNAEIAQRLHVSEGTVKTHVSRILSKLDLRDRVQAVIVAYESGLTSLHDV